VGWMGVGWMGWGGWGGGQAVSAIYFNENRTLILA